MLENKTEGQILQGWAKESTQLSEDDDDNLTFYVPDDKTKGICKQINDPTLNNKQIKKEWISKESLIKLLQSFQIDGSMSIAKTQFLKGQKHGELLMIKKLLNNLKVKRGKINDTNY